MCRRILYCSSEIGESHDCSSAARSAGRFDCCNRATQLDRRDFQLYCSARSLRSNRRCLQRRSGNQLRLADRDSRRIPCRFCHPCAPLLEII